MFQANTLLHLQFLRGLVLQLMSKVRNDKFKPEKFHAVNVGFMSLTLVDTTASLS